MRLETKMVRIFKIKIELGNFTSHRVHIKHILNYYMKAKQLLCFLNFHYFLKKFSCWAIWKLGKE